MTKAEAIIKNMNLEKLFQEAQPVIIETGQFLVQELGKVSNEKIEIKSLNSLVSYVDKTAEKMLVKGLAQCLPHSTFLTEEETVSQERGEFQWIIDPLDGTTNFLHQLPVFSVSVALRQGDEVILGIVYEPNRDECFYAWKNGGAFLNGKKISVKKKTTLADSLLATGFPYYEFSKSSNYLKLIGQLMQKTRGLRRMGSAAVDLAYTACGRFDAYFEYNLQIWDIAAGYFIVQEAGGQVSDFSGGKNHTTGAEIVAGTAPVCEEILEIMKECFPKKE